MEYASQAWSPWCKKDIDVLEKVQERMLKMCSGLKGNTYEERLLEVGLDSLADRRVRADMIQVWKVLNKKVRIDEKNFFTRLNVGNTRTTRATSSGVNLQIPRANLELRKNFFSCRTPSLWNNIPENVKVAPSLTAFKTAYDSWMKETRHAHPSQSHIDR